MHFNQDQIFAVSEGDNWFNRNKHALDQFDSKTDLPLKLIETYQLHPRNVLEVGAANGARLAVISKNYNARVVAVEPSRAAIIDGKSRYSHIEYIRAGASAIPLKECFDLIIVNFVFHWIDRASILRSMAEIDRLLMDRGHLIIGDFCPSNLTKVRYHHLLHNEVFTYKQNYAATFLASGLYHSVCLMTGNHASRVNKGNIPESERIGVWLLQKMLDEHYIESPFFS